MPKSLQSLDDHTQDTIDARRRVQSARFQNIPEGVERVSDVLQASCSSVAQAFESIGFRWSQSGLRFARKTDVFTHAISFKPDAENLSGAHVGVSIYAQAKSQKLAKWREINGIANDGIIWTSQIGYLPPSHEYLKWQLVEQSLRYAEIESMIQAINQRALPAFEACSSIARLSASIQNRPEITCVPDWAVDVALWTGNRSAAEELVGAQLSVRADIAADFRKLLTLEASQPSHAKPVDRLHRLAWVVQRNGLRVPGVA